MAEAAVSCFRSPTSTSLADARALRSAETAQLADHRFRCSSLLSACLRFGDQAQARNKPVLAAAEQARPCLALAARLLASTPTTHDGARYSPRAASVSTDIACSRAS